MRNCLQKSVCRTAFATLVSFHCILVVAAKLDSLATLAMTGDLPQNVNYAIKADYLVPLLKTVEGLTIGKEQTKDVNLLELIKELKKSVVMIKVY